MEKFNSLCSQLEAKILVAYEEGTTLEQAERLAAEFLYAQLQVSSELSKLDLSSKMRKTGVKAVKAAIYMDAATKDPKKPSDVMLQAIVDMNEVVQSEQNEFDKAEVSRAELERIYDVFLNAHIFFRGVARGNFNA